MEPRIDKLPKWAQDEISKMNYQIRQLRVTNRTLRKINPESNTIVLLDFPGKFYLDDGQRVEFRGKGVRVRVFVDLEGIVRVDFDEGVIIPQGRNIIYITDKHNTTNR